MRTTFCGWKAWSCATWGLSAACTILSSAATSASSSAGLATQYITHCSSSRTRYDAMLDMLTCMPSCFDMHYISAHSDTNMSLLCSILQSKSRLRAAHRHGLHCLPARSDSAKLQHLRSTSSQTLLIVCAGSM